MPTVIGMSSLTRPVGPEEPIVYWRRRVSLLLVVVVLAGLVAFALTRFGGDDAAAAGGDGEPAAAAVADEPATERAADPRTCSPEQVQVVATADAGSYAAGTTPQLGVTVRNTGADACTVDLGAAQVELLVVSGADRIWSSRDCEQDTASSVLTVEPAGEQARVVPWPRARSAAGCPSDLAEPRAGTYQLTAAVGGVTSAPLSFGLE